MAEVNKNKIIVVKFNNKTIIKIMVIGALAMLIFYLARKILPAVKLISIAGFLALALNPAVSKISKILPSKSRVRATAVAYTVVMTIVISFLAIVIPPLVKQTGSFVNTIPLTVEDINNQDTAIVRFIQRNNLTNQYTSAVSEIKNKVGHIGGGAFSVVATLGGGITASITVVVMAFMMLVEGPYWIEKLLEMQPQSKVEKRSKVAKEMYMLFTGYVNGQLLIAAIAATFAFFALVIISTLFGVVINPIPLVAIVGLIGLIPMIGNTIASVVVVMFCLFVSLPFALAMGVFFLIYQQVENATLQPYIQSRYNELTPLTVFASAIIGVSMAGFIGALVAIPLVGCLRIYIKAYFGNNLKLQISDK